MTALLLIGVVAQVAGDTWHQLGAEAVFAAGVLAGVAVIFQKGIRPAFRLVKDASHAAQWIQLKMQEELARNGRAQRAGTDGLGLRDVVDELVLEVREHRRRLDRVDAHLGLPSLARDEHDGGAE